MNATANRAITDPKTAARNAAIAKEFGYPETWNHFEPFVPTQLEGSDMERVRETVRATIAALTTNQLIAHIGAALTSDTTHPYERRLLGRDTGDRKADLVLRSVGLELFMARRDASSLIQQWRDEENQRAAAEAMAARSLVAAELSDDGASRRRDAERRNLLSRGLAKLGPEGELVLNEWVPVEQGYVAPSPNSIPVLTIASDKEREAAEKARLEFIREAEEAGLYEELTVRLTSESRYSWIVSGLRPLEAGSTEDEVTNDGSTEEATKLGASKDAVASTISAIKAARGKLESMIAARAKRADEAMELEAVELVRRKFVAHLYRIGRYQDLMDLLALQGRKGARIRASLKHPLKEGDTSVAVADCDTAVKDARSLLRQLPKVKVSA